MDALAQKLKSIQDAPPPVEEEVAKLTQKKTKAVMTKLLYGPDKTLVGIIFDGCFGIYKFLKGLCNLGNR